MKGMPDASHRLDDKPRARGKEVIMMIVNRTTKVLVAVACIGSLAFWYCGGDGPSTTDVVTTTTTGASEPVQQPPQLPPPPAWLP